MPRPGDGGRAPAENVPVLILLDELVLHMDKLTEQEVGNILGFLRIQTVRSLFDRHDFAFKST